VVKTIIAAKLLLLSFAKTPSGLYLETENNWGDRSVDASLAANFLNSQ
jgi:hypothetical protein